MNNIVLIGPPGSGKTSCGQILSDKLSVSFFDTDALIIDKAKLSIPEIFSQLGEQHFRQMETQVLIELCQSPGAFVLSTGGGTPVKPGNFSKLSEIGQVVLLEAALDVLFERVKKAAQSRPLLSDLQDTESAKRRLADLLAARNDIYQQADYKIDTSLMTPAQTAQAVIDVLKLDA